jgi:Flp pilus assembly protein CpaB
MAGRGDALMSRRARSVAFLLLAVGCASLAAAVANGYGSSVAQSFGPLRKVVVARRELSAGKSIGPARLSDALQVRRIPIRFVPPGALSIPQAALGQAPAAPIPAGSYVLAAQLRSPRARGARRGLGLAQGRRPVEIAVNGGQALLTGGGSPAGSKVDVVVTSEPHGSGPGRTYVAAANVKLLALTEQDPSEPGPAAGWSATLALTRGQALRLIEAENFARAVRLLPRPGSA